MFKTSFTLAMFLPTVVCAATISATSGSATISNTYGGPEGSSFQLTGPSLNVSATGGSAVGYNVTQTLNNPFNLSLNLLISDNGYEGGSGTAGGVNYPSVAFSNSNTLVITDLSPITLTAGNLTATVGATLSGGIAACTTASICIYGGGVPANPFNVSVAPIAGSLTVTYANINPPVSSQYGLISAVFTPNATPEPATFALFGGALLAGFAARKRLFRKAH